jgi:hypothetical protein
VAAGLGIGIEVCAPTEVGNINPPPTKVAANKNCRRETRWSSSSFRLVYLPGKKFIGHRAASGSIQVRFEHGDSGDISKGKLEGCAGTVVRGGPEPSAVTFISAHRGI